MKTFIFMFVVVLFLSANVSAENRTYLKDGKIVVDTESGSNVVDYDSDDLHHRTQIYKRWDIKEEVNPLKEALAVYQEKGRSVYAKKIWIFDKENGQIDVTFEIATDNPKERIILNDNESFGYYVGLTGEGVESIYGIALNEDKSAPFLITDGNGFDLINCGNQSSYVIVKDDKEKEVYLAYDEQGKLMQSLEAYKDKDDAKRILCIGLDDTAAN